MSYWQDVEDGLFSDDGEYIGPTCDDDLFIDDDTLNADWLEFGN